MSDNITTFIKSMSTTTVLIINNEQGIYYNNSFKTTNTITIIRLNIYTLENINLQKCKNKLIINCHIIL